MKKPAGWLAAGTLLAMIVAVTGYQLQQNREVTPTGPIVVQNPYVVPEKPFIGSTRPEFELRDIDGTRRTVSEWDGKIVVLNFWATWCAPCLAEIPEFIKLQEKYGDQGLQFVGIALHEADEIRGYLAGVGMNYPALVGKEAATQIAKSYGNRFTIVPYTVVIDRDRSVYFVRSGPIRYDETDAIINSLLRSDNKGNIQVI